MTGPVRDACGPPARGAVRDRRRRGLVTTLAVPVVAPLQFAYPAPSLRVALDTGVAVIGLLATAIVVRGWRDGLRLDRLSSRPAWR